MRARVKRDELDVMAREPRQRAPHVVHADRAHVTEVLSHDDVGPSALELLEIDLVDRERLLDERAHVAVDSRAARQSAHAGAGENRHVLEVWRKVALVRAPDQALASAERTDDFSRRREERYDPRHGGSCYRPYSSA